MEIVKDYPPNIHEIAKKFKLHKGVVFTYGNKLYNPDDGPIDTALLIHEQTHTEQQGDDPESWWKRYISDPKFRINQEVEAYQNQYQRMKRNIKNLVKLEQRLNMIAQDLSGEMYGSVMSFENAKRLITEEYLLQ